METFIIWFTYQILQLLFLCGLAFLIGMEKTFFFFFQRHKIKGSGCFFSGIIIVFLGWPIIGMLLELYGFILLFGYLFVTHISVLKNRFTKETNFIFDRGFLPVAINFIRRLPGLSVILNLPGISSVSNGIFWHFPILKIGNLFVYLLFPIGCGQAWRPGWKNTSVIWISYVLQNVKFLFFLFHFATVRKIHVSATY